MQPPYVLWTGNIYAGADGKNTIRLEATADGGFDLTDVTYDERVEIPKKIIIPIFEQDLEKDAPPAFVAPTLVLRGDLLQDLRMLGAKNFTSYPATLRHSTGRQWDDYYVIKIDGFLDAIDRSKSKISRLSRGNHILYDRMVLDESKCKNCEIFRVASRKNLVFVSQRVVDCFTTKKYPYLNFIPPEEFA